MSSREERSSSWRADPDATPASGGHLAPDITSTGSPYDPLNAPLPSEIERLERQREPERTEVIPRAPQRPPPTPSRRRARAAASRRVKRTLRHVDPLSVLKLSMFFYACFLVIWLIFVAVLYFLLDGFGLFKAIEDFAGPQGMVLNIPDLTLGWFERWAFVIGFTMFVVGTLVNTFLAVLYNIGADILGGLDLTFVERDLGG